MNLRCSRREAAIGVLVLTAAIFATGLACTPPGGGTTEPARPQIRTLTIVTPHSSRIRQAFEIGFADWYRKERKADASIDWIVLGTPECVRYVDGVLSGATTLPDSVRVRKIPDVMFGGGIADHQQLAALGLSKSLDIGQAGASVPAEVNGLPTRDKEGHWCATGLSAFGIMFNATDCAARGMAPPATWSDLGDSRFQGWIALADPSASGSHLQAMTMILQSQGWDKGWGTLLRICGNSRALLPSSTEALDEIDRGVFLAGFVVNFEGMARAEASGGKLAYVNPAGATAATPDVISILKSANDSELAQDFVRYCLSEQGQTAWGARQDGDSGSIPTLYHYPIVPSVYETLGDKLALKENPLKVDLGVRVDLEQATRLNRILPLLIQASCGANHIALQKASAALIAGGLPADEVAALYAPPMPEAAAMQQLEKYSQAPPEEAAAMQADWAKLFAERYAKILSAGKGT
jgi:ABC-type Fe3+ transport system substrate-binding protein